MKFLTAIFCICAVISTCLANIEEWQSFKQKYGKTYKSVTEEKVRMAVFNNNRKNIETHNKMAKEGKFSFTLGINQFTDLLNEEYQKLMTKKQEFLETKIPKIQRKQVHQFPKDVPDEIDYRTSGCITGVTDQGQCGGEWSKVSLETIQAQNCLIHGSLVELSEQNLLDCTIPYGNFGCGQGSPDNSYRYVVDNGIDTAESYPYVGVVGDCKFNPDTVGATISGYIDIPSGDEESMKEDVANYGPVAVYLDASQLSFQLYTGGIYYEPLCNPDLLDHLMTVVGYGSENGEDYWIAKNTWGTSWGEQGYIRMARNRDNNCGIASMSSLPVVI